MTTERIIRAGKMGWTLTDDDCFQWQRGVIRLDRPLAQCFEMCQITKMGDEYRICHGIVTISDVSSEELDALVRMYGYNGLEGFVQESAPTTEFVFNVDGSIDRENSPAWILEYALLAEMDFETNALSEYMTDYVFTTEEEAHQYIFQNILSKEVPGKEVPVW